MATFTLREFYLNTKNLNQHMRCHDFTGRAPTATWKFTGLQIKCKDWEKACLPPGQEEQGRGWCAGWMTDRGLLTQTPSDC